MTVYTPNDPSITTLCQAFQRSVREGGDTVALRTADGAQPLTWRELGERVRRIAGGLAELGVEKGEPVGMMLTNRPEFHLVDLAAMHLGAVGFSVYNTSSAEQVAYILGNAGNRVVVTEEQFLPKVLQAVEGTKVEYVVCVDATPEGTLSLEDVERDSAEGFDFDAAWRAVEGDDVVTLIYTSGTTGNPKGVELTHANVLYSVDCVTSLTGELTGGSTVSYLPDAHLANRNVAHYVPMFHRLAVTTVSDPRTLIATLGEVRPTVFLAVPALWYKIKAALEASVGQEAGLKRRLAAWAFEVGQHKAKAEVDGAPLGVADRLRYSLADRLVLSKIRAKLGLSEMKVAVSGAAPIDPDALVFLLGLGLRVSEAWGMTETTGLTTMNPLDAVRIGTVGVAAPGTEVRLAEDGELLVRGPGVMRGYRNDPERTAEALDADRWMHTGDIGTIDSDGYVRIVDRKKELIINAAGKNMSPTNIENALAGACPLVGSVVAIGDDRPFISALVVLDPDAATAYAAAHSLEADPAVLAEDEGVRTAIAAGVEAANRKLSRVEHIRAWQVLPTFWQPGSDELTPTMKLKRRPIAEKYAPVIDSLYAR
jgi:long-subunit acyl-CoA synthetase (AMP-forming)